SMESYPYATDLYGGVIAGADGKAIDDDNRFYPLAASYFRLKHKGGQIWFGIEEEASQLNFTLHRVADGEKDGPVEEALDTWTGSTAEAWPVAGGEDLDEGGYWVVGTYPVIADQSIKVRICLGDEETATGCAPNTEPDDNDDDPPTESEVKGCGCNAGALLPTPWLLMLVLPFLRRRQN
ncbi:MAG: hypothetical protein HN348_32300, partial [Proteobacteria bacterium]|nr:hypothetical protein [Pseudomonadota bacterium]